jgi:hypothetical protein
MLSSLRLYRRELEAKDEAEERCERKKELAENRRKHRRPFLMHEAYDRRYPKQKSYRCSECERVLHRTARFCLECGAWFTNRKVGK